MIRKHFFLLALVLATGASGLIIIGLHKNPNGGPLTANREDLVTTHLPSPSGQSPTLNTSPPKLERAVEVTVSTNQGSLNLENALTNKYGDHATFVVNSSRDGFAQGTLKTSGKQEKWWLAVENKSQWEIVADGYAYVNCKDIVSYSFPRSMVPVCWGKGTLVSR